MAEKDIYSEKGMDDQADNDQISPREEAFMEGAIGDGFQGKCARCGKMLEEENTHEKEYNGKILFFCSEEHANQGPQH